MNTEFRPRTPEFFPSAQVWIRWGLLLLLLAVFIALFYPGFFVTPHIYQVGDITAGDIKATRDFFVEDEEATIASRRQAIEQVLTVYDYDPRMTNQSADRILSAFEMMRHLGVSATARPPHAAPAAAGEADRANHEQELWAQKENFENRLGIRINRGAYKLLINDGFSTQMADLIVRITSEILNNGVVSNKDVLLRESEKGIVLRNVADQTERTVFALRQYHSPDQAKTMVRIVAEPMLKDMNYTTVNLVVDLAQALLQPNISLNRNETEQRKKKALAAVKPVMYQIKAGEMLLREGERVNQTHLLKLQAMQHQTGDRKLSTSGVGAAVLMAMLLTAMYTLYLRHPRYAKFNQPHHLIFMTLILLMVLATAKTASFLSSASVPNAVFSIPDETVVYAAPVAAGVMLVCLYLGYEIALAFSVVAAACATLLLGQHLDLFLFFLIGNAMAAHWIVHCRERSRIITAGARLGLLNALLATALVLYQPQFAPQKMFWAWPMAFLGGMTSGIVVLGLAPLVEIGFHYTTDMSLMELANLDRPILRQLMLEAPGTYHHSVIVGSLVEAAAANIGANPLLAKVCGYYHDIGKVKKPQYFIENQTNGRNKHDKLAPSMSSLILIAHVKDGVEIARRHKLVQPIIDTIQQHHGTSLISYFLEKSRQMKGEDNVKIENFRYPGPKPQTKEAGLVMLADVVEAASRTLENPTPARIQGQVQHLINKVFSEGQLDDCELTLRDLHSIAKSFNLILYGIHHHRIEYNEPNREEARIKNGSIDRQSANKPSNRDQGRPKEGAATLKRLGLS